MIFRIERTSDVVGGKSPCQNAHFVKREKPYDFANYKVNYWEIEIVSLEELLQLIKETEHPIIMFDSGDQSCPVIEIYDDYRE